MGASDEVHPRLSLWLAYLAHDHSACSMGGRAGARLPYGAVYFRKSGPPEEDWARDHQTAAKAGMNMFRHWVMWSGVEVAPGKYDWRDYDRMMDLEAQNGIKTILAE